MAIKIQGTVVLDYDGASYSSTNIAVGASALASITTGAYNVGVGYQALYENTTGFSNVGVGYLALHNNTIGSDNVGVGVTALLYNTTGINNVGVGAAALYYNTTGTNNVGVGYAALYNNTIGNDNVGVGVNALNNNTTGINNVGVGPAALYYNTTGANNVGVGYFALFSNTTGINNIGVGTAALHNNTIGYQNVGVGISALYNNTIGINNIGVGTSALYYNTTGTNNVGVGALNNNTTGSYNVGVGVSALVSNTTGNYNIGVGYVALYNNTTGEYNIGVGTSALYNNTTGNYNVGVGHIALQSNTTGVSNVGVGYLALQSNTTGNYNVGVGYAALYDQTTAQYNTAIGYDTGRGITTGSYNTIIGAQVTGLSATLNNTVIIADGAGNQRIYADSTGNVGIGTSVPSQKLQVLATTDQLSLTTGTNELIVRASSTEAALYTFQAIPMVFYTNNAEGMRIDSSGNVGIGTSAPGYKLTVDGLAAFGVASGVYQNYADMRLQTATGYGWRTGTTSTGSTHGYFYIQGSTDNFVSSFINGLNIDTSGNVGIGTGSPNAKLDVNSGSLGTSDGNQLEQARFTSTNISGSYLRIFTERDGAGSDWFTAFTRIQQRIDVTDMGYIQFNGAGNLQGLSFGTANTERMSIDSAGNVTIIGSLTKGSGSFKIDHPLKPDTHHLVHSFVEAPTADNIYRGRVDLVDGVATVDIDEAARLSGGTFVALNTNTDCWVNNKTGWTAVRATVSGSILSIEAQDNSCADTVSWLVIGERHDQTIIDATWTDEAGRVITEPQKDH